MSKMKGRSMETADTCAKTISAENVTGTSLVRHTTGFDLL